MNKLIYGSTALKHWLPDLKREPKDLDYIGVGKSTREVEYHWCDSFQYIIDNNQDHTYVDLNFLYTIKISHASWDIRWDKTMFDINFMKERGAVLDHTLYKMLLKEWDVIHYKKRVKLKGTPSEFFTEKVSRKIPHEDLHRLLMFYDRPMHEVIRKDINDVACSKALWDALSFDDKIKCASEEMFVFACERYNNFPPKIAIAKALKQLITQSTKGWFNLFLIDNYLTLRYNTTDKFLRVFEEIKNE